MHILFAKAEVWSDQKTVGPARQHRTAVCNKDGRRARPSLPTLPGTDGTIGRLGTLNIITNIVQILIASPPEPVKRSRKYNIPSNSP